MESNQAPKLAAPAGPVIQAVITEDHVAVLGPPVSLLERLLTYTRRTFVLSGPLGYREVEETVWLCDTDVKGRPCFPAGLFPRLRQMLREQGYRVTVEDLRTPGPRLMVDDSAINGADAGTKPLLQAVARQPLGQIEAATRKDMIDKMLLFGEVFPEARVVVAVATTRHAWSLWRKLKEHLGGVVGLAMRGAKEAGKRWLVGTFGSIPRDKAGTFDILLLPYAEEAVGNRAIDMVVRMQFRRIYAFIQPCRRPDQLIQIRLEQMAGPVIHRVQKPRVPVHVLMLPTLACTVGSAGTALERKRALYWHNDARNGHITAVAQAVVNADRAALKAVGFRNKDIRLLKDADTSKVVVLVESPEHGRELLARLPDWRMLDLVPGNLATADGGSTVESESPAV